MTPEQKARQKIDAAACPVRLDRAGLPGMNISAGLGVAIREFPLKTGFAD